MRTETQQPENRDKAHFYQSGKRGRDKRGEKRSRCVEVFEPPQHNRVF